MNVPDKKFQLIAVAFQMNDHPGVRIIYLPRKIVLPGKKVNKWAETYALYQSIDSYSVSCIDGNDCFFLFSKATQ
jgi:hypothetical protein